MNIINGLACRLAKVGSISTMVFGLSFPAFAGAILSDFTVANPNGPIADSTYQQVFGAGDSFSTGPMTFYLLPEIGANLTIQAFRSALVTLDSGTTYNPIRLSRRTTANENDTDNRGLNVCSTYLSIEDKCRSADSTAIDGHGSLGTESVKFSIDEAGGFEFAVQLFTFGDVGLAEVNSLPNDNARMYFNNNNDAVEEFIDFNVRSAGVCVPDAPFNDNSSTNVNRTCQVNIYAVVNAQIFSGLADDDAIFNYLESRYFRFAAIGGQDDWYIRGAQWVVAGPAINILDVPEPASMTLLGAGLFGLGYFGKRRTRYANA